MYVTPSRLLAVQPLATGNNITICMQYYTKRLSTPISPVTDDANSTLSKNCPTGPEILRPVL